MKKKKIKDTSPASSRRPERRTERRNGFIRLFITAIIILLQIGWLFFLYNRVADYYTWINFATEVLAIFLVLYIYGKPTNTASRMLWIIVILLLPLLGVLLYVLFGRQDATRFMKKKFKRAHELLSTVPRPASNAPDEAIATYLKREGFPAVSGEQVTYYPDAALALEAQLDALSQAKKFIFMEYHAIEDRESFARIKDVLARKVKEGVTVRIIYDDIGSIFFINKSFKKSLAALGIECRAFNSFLPFLSVFMNNRDHRKITVIDGAIAFTGGYNLANEYFNLIHPYGHWKDVGVRLSGEAVSVFTSLFLEMWNAIRMTDTPEALAAFFPECPWEKSGETIVQPYADSPLDVHFVGENVYLNMINTARERVWFMTPYLLITEEMMRALVLASSRGVDVRIITPGIPDKKIVYRLTRSYYPPLVKAGVKIYEYTPGFIHAKTCLRDHDAATVGTINLDYRSLYLHFEDGVFLRGGEAIKDLEQDFKRTFAESHDVSNEDRYLKHGDNLTFGETLLRLVAHML